MKKALFSNNNGSKIKCLLCGHHCLLDIGQTGICGVRKNIQGVLHSLNHGKIVAANIDPVEKKPLYHFLAGTASYSIACVGCNFKCGFCQNWQISQSTEFEKLNADFLEMSASCVIDQAIKNKCPSISYTYTEPTVYFEFAYECAILAHEKKLKNIFVTNGFMGKKSLECIKPYLDAANVDLKSFRDSFYRKICQASLNPVLDNIVLMKQLGIWLEITTLLIPGVNDSQDELSDIAAFIASVDKDIPWHISRFHPDYKFIDSILTPSESLKTAYKIGQDKGLRYVYVGNILDSQADNTYCPSCKKIIVSRQGFSVKQKNINNGCCSFCQTKIPGVWDK